MKTILVDAVNTFVCNGKIDMDMKAMLDNFPNNKIIMTNADAEKQIEFGLIDLPYPLFTQSFDPMKTDPQFYTNFLKEYNLDASNVVYFEHHEGAVESARNLGIMTYHYDMEHRDIDAVKEFLDNNI